MKKIMMTMAVLVGMMTGAMMLSAFTTPKQDVKAESSQIQMNDDPWQLYRENVAYCDGDTDQCIGKGNVYVNTDTYQIQIQLWDNRKKYDLTEYTGKAGYNYRFWHSGVKCYYYVYLNVRF